MNLQTEQYYHMYNRTNNNELLFREDENYRYFLQRYRHHIQDRLDTLAYCLMPTHFHFLIRVNTENTSELKRKIGVWLSAYTKAINKRYDRHGSLFQQHAKAKHVDQPDYLIKLAAYIHQNPIRAGYVEALDQWPYSSYHEYAGLRNGSLPNTELIMNQFQSTGDFVAFSQQTIKPLPKAYWV